MAGRVLGAVAVAATAGLAVLALAIPASAHTPKLWAKCVDEKTVLSVELKSYSKGKTNTVTVTDNGAPLEKAEFSEGYTKKWDQLDATIGHTFVVQVAAGDDPDGKKGWSFEKVLKVEKCVKTPPSSSSATPPSSTSSDVPVPSSETPTSSTVPPAPGGAEPEPPLAATGASPVWTMLAGLGLIGAGALALILVRRKRA